MIWSNFSDSKAAHNSCFNIYIFFIDIQELKELEIEDEDNALSESLGSTRLGKRVDRMISNIEKRLQQLEEELIENPEALRIDIDG